MARPQDLIGIGAFARRVRLSPRQLRDYDELGLLAPAYVDPDSGYRYYHRGQARSAITIGLLRSLGVPLPEIHTLLVAEPRRWRRARTSAGADRRRVERGVQALRALDRLIGSEELMPYDVAERVEPALTLTGLHGTLHRRGELDAAAAALIGELPDGPVTGLYPLDLEGEIEFFVGVPGPGLRCCPRRGWPCPHRGRYAELPLAYFALLAHAEERGHRPGAWVRERYLAAPPDVAPEAALTEVLLTYE